MSFKAHVFAGIVGGVVGIVMCLSGWNLFEMAYRAAQRALEAHVVERWEIDTPERLCRFLCWDREEVSKVAGCNSDGGCFEQCVAEHTGHPMFWRKPGGI